VTEVRRRLIRAGYREAMVQAALDRLTAVGYLDDDVFARAWVESRDRAKPRGERALRSELLAKGVDRAVIELVLAERRSGPDEIAGAEYRGSGAEASADADEHADESTSADELAARRLLDRHRRALEREPDSTRRRQKAYALLARNGFDPDVCRAAAASMAGADGPDGPDEPPDSN
jgi:SOS response regulatory protein OraA/RecX